MMLHDAARDSPLSVRNPTDAPPRDSWIPLMVVAIATIGIMAMVFPRSPVAGGADTSFSKVQTYAPGPVPVTDRRPAPSPK
jgi:hypothetical protein